MKAEMIPRAALCVALTLSCLACAPAPEEPAKAGPEGHRWTPIETDADSELETAKEQIAALAYLKGDQAAPEQIGVQVIDAERAQPGLNLVLSAHRTAAFLMDLEGTFLHRWELDPTTAGHGLEELPDDVVWPRAHLYPNGDLLVVYQASADAETGALVKIDRDSNLLWARLDAYHHDFWVAESGEIHVLNQRTVTRPWFRDTPVYDNLITVLDSDGEPLREISILDAIHGSDLEPDLMANRDRSHPDVLHANAVTVFTPGALLAGGPAAGGDMLVSMWTLNALAVIDADDGALTWSRTGSWRGQHKPEILADGRLLVFDNHNPDGPSRVLEIEPATGDVVWECADRAGQTFFTRTSGSSQRLLNGNTLITVTEEARVFEVTRDGDVVWEWVSVFKHGEHEEYIAWLMEVLRLDDAQVAWLARD